MLLHLPSIQFSAIQGSINHHMQYVIQGVKFWFEHALVSMKCFHLRLVVCQAETLNLVQLNFMHSASFSDQNVFNLQAFNYFSTCLAINIFAPLSSKLALQLGI